MISTPDFLIRNYGIQCQPPAHGEIVKIPPDNLDAYLADHPLFIYHRKSPPNRLTAPKPSSKKPPGPKPRWLRTQLYCCTYRFSKPPHSIRKGKKRRRLPTVATPRPRCGCHFIVRFRQPSPSDPKPLVQVEWYEEHNHSLGTVASVAQNRPLHPAMRAWIRQQAADGREASAILEQLARAAADLRPALGQDQVPEALLVQPHHVHAIIRQEKIRASRRDKDLWTSMKEWMEELKGQGSTTQTQQLLVQTTRKDLPGGIHHAWTAGFVTPWQRGLLTAARTFCIDSTHCTCVGLGGESIYLFSIVVRNPKTGQGAPVGFMLSNSQAAPPLQGWLESLRDKLGIQPLTVVIDCSHAEHEAVALTWPSTSIIYCWYHVSAAVYQSTQSKLKLKEFPSSGERSAEREKIWLGFKALYQKEQDQAGFQAGWEAYSMRYKHEEEWISYLTRQWMGSPGLERRIAYYGRSHAHGGIETNNLIERWHGTLKHKYLRGTRKQRCDYVIHVLVTRVLPDWEHRELQHELGIIHQNLSKAERRECEAAAEVDPGVVTSLVQEETDGLFTVASTKDPALLHTVQTRWDVDESRLFCYGCSCEAFQRGEMRCKHMFLLARALDVNVELSVADGPSAIVPRPANDLQSLQETMAARQTMLIGLPSIIAALMTYTRQIHDDQVSDVELQGLYNLLDVARLAAASYSRRARGCIR